MPNVFKLRSFELEEDACTLHLSAWSVPRRLIWALQAAVPGLTCAIEAGHLTLIAGGGSVRRVSFLGLDGRTQQVVELLTAMAGAIQVEDDCELSECLAFYRIPEEDLAPDEWPLTQTGGMFHRAKYAGSGAAAARLSDRIITRIRQHPLLRTVAAVAAVPPSDPRPHGEDPYSSRGSAGAHNQSVACNPV